MPMPFHLAFPVQDLATTRAFYCGLLGCREARAHADSLELDFFGHQLVAHVAPDEVARKGAAESGAEVPPRHFGLVLPWAEWEAFGARLRAAGVRFRIEPHVESRGPGGDQATFFLDDPSGNVLEFKSFRDPARMFAR